MSDILNNLWETAIVFWWVPLASLGFFFMEAALHVNLENAEKKLDGLENQCEANIHLIKVIAQSNRVQAFYLSLIAGILSFITVIILFRTVDNALFVMLSLGLPFFVTRAAIWHDSAKL